MKISYPFVINQKSDQAEGLLLWAPGLGGGFLAANMVRLNSAKAVFGTAPANGQTVPGIDGGKDAIVFDGSSIYCDWESSGLDSKYVITDELTFSFWMRTSSSGQFYMGGKWGVPGGSTAYLVLTDGSGHVQFNTSTSGSFDPSRQITSTKLVDDDVWHLICCTYDSVNMKLYIDGKLDASVAATGTLFNPSQPLVFGRLSDNNLTSNSYQGLAEDFRLYEVCISANIVEQMYDPSTRWELRKRPKLITYLKSTVTNPASNTLTFSQDVECVKILNVSTSNSFVPEQDVSGGGQLKVIFITTGTTFTAPSDWPGIASSIECIGGGAGGLNAALHVGKGGGGGGYSSESNLTLTDGDNLQIGQGGSHDTDGTDTWIGGTDFASSLCGAKGGLAGGLGGQASDGIGSIKFSGGAGGDIGADQTCGAGGGSSAGPLGSGGDGGVGGGLSAAAGGGGTGGAGNASSGPDAGDGGIGSDGTAGGLGATPGVPPTAGSHGSGGGGGAALNETGANGGDGIEWDFSHGAGGGGGGSDQNTGNNHFGGNGGLYGGGGGGEAWSHQSGSSGGTGANGIIRITYNAFIDPTKDASNTLTISQLAEASNDTVKTASNTLTFTGAATGFSGTKFPTSVLTLVSAAAIVKTSNVSGSNTLSLRAVADVLKLNPASNSLTFSQTAVVTNSKGAFGVLAFTQAATYNYTPHFALPSNVFALTQTLNKSVGKTVSQTFTASQLAIGLLSKSASASNLFIIANSASTAKILGAFNSLSFSQEVDEFKVVQPFVSSTLVLTQDVERQAFLNLNIVSPLTLLHVYQKQTQIQGIFFNTPVPEVIVTKVLNRISFRTTDRAIILLPPELNDTESPTNKIVLQRTMTGGTYVYARRTTTRKLKYTFETDQFKALEMRRFMLDCISTPMWVENWKGELWIGYVTNNPIEFKTVGRGKPCGDRYSFDIEFEGARIH